MHVMRGDQYALTFRGTVDGEALDMDKIDLIEFMVGNLRKTYPGEVSVNSDGDFLFPLTQEETFSFVSTVQPIQIRVKFSGADESVIGTCVEDVLLAASLSKVVL